MLGSTITFHADTSGKSTLEAFELTARLVAASDIVSPVLRARIRDRTPVGRGGHAGRLRDSVTAQRRTSIGWVRLEFHSKVPYAPYVIKGTKPHTILPVAARMLHWTTPDGQDVFARRVQHPGTKANNYPRRAASDLMPFIALTYHQALSRR